MIEKEGELEGIFSHSNACISSVDLKLGKFKLSLGTEKLYGYIEKDFNQYPLLWKEMIHPFDLPKVEEIEKMIYAEKKRETFISEHRIIRGDGEIIWVAAHFTPIFTVENEVKKVNIFSYDITDRKKAEEKIQHMAFHDNLTNLPNRPLFSKFVEKSLSYSKRNNTQFALMYIDIDHFKQVNDTFGHNAGDRLLIEIAKRLNESVRTNDVVCRHGGDEFMILLDDVKQEDIEAVAKRIIKKLSYPINILNENEVFISPSIGISLYPFDGENEHTLIKKADAAMYLVKKNGKNNYQFGSTGPVRTLP
nr:sensor domain-containing diguanylate cyclase [Halalkalibacter alkaliphilus]